MRRKDFWGTLRGRASMTTVDSTPPDRPFEKSAARRFRWLVVMALCFGCHDPSPAEETLSDEVPPPTAVDYALSFDGQNDYGTLGTARCPMPTAAQTVSLWISPQATGSNSDLVTLRRDDSGNAFGLSAEGTPTMWRIWGSLVLAETSEAIEPGHWHHVAYVYDSETHSIYIDGVLKGTSTNTPNNRSPTSGWLGSFDGKQRFYAGLLDEVRIWAVARTQAELQAEIDGAAPISDPDLVAYFSFDEARGTRVYDRSGNGNHLALGDGAAEFAPTRVESRP